MKVRKAQSKSSSSFFCGFISTLTVPLTVGEFSSKPGPCGISQFLVMSPSLPHKSVDVVMPTSVMSPMVVFPIAITPVKSIKHYRSTNPKISGSYEGKHEPSCKTREENCLLLSSLSGSEPSSQQDCIVVALAHLTEVSLSAFTALH